MSKKPLICPEFKRDYPADLVQRAEALGVRITMSDDEKNGRPAVYWLDLNWQLTGYTTRKDGTPFTHEDAVRNIDKALTAVEEDRKEIEGMSEAERFARVIDDLRQMEPQYRMIGSSEFPSGDGGGIFFMASYDGTVRLHGLGDVAKAKVQSNEGTTPKDRLNLLCDRLVRNYAARSGESA